MKINIQDEITNLLKGCVQSADYGLSSTPIEDMELHRSSMLPEVQRGQGVGLGFLKEFINSAYTALTGNEEGLFQDPSAEQPASTQAPREVQPEHNYTPLELIDKAEAEIDANAQSEGAFVATVMIAVNSIRQIALDNATDTSVCDKALAKIKDICSRYMGMEGLDSADKAISSIAAIGAKTDVAPDTALAAIDELFNANRQNTSVMGYVNALVRIAKVKSDVRNDVVEKLDKIRQENEEYKTITTTAIKKLGGSVEAEEAPSLTDQINEQKDKASGASAYDADACMDNIVQLVTAKGASTEENGVNTADTAINALTEICGNENANPVRVLCSIYAIAGRKDVDKENLLTVIKKLYDDHKEKLGITMTMHYIRLIAEKNEDSKTAAIDVIKEITGDDEAVKPFMNTAVKDLGGEVETTQEVVLTPTEQIQKLIDDCKAEENALNPDKALDELAGIVIKAKDDEDAKDVATAAVGAVKTICTEHDGKGVYGLFCLEIIDSAVEGVTADCITITKTLYDAVKGGNDAIGAYEIISTLKRFGRHEDTRETAVSMLKEIMPEFTDYDDVFRSAVKALGGEFEEEQEQERTPLEEIAWQKDNYESLDDGDDKDDAMKIGFTNIMNVVEANKDKQEESDAAVEALVDMASKTDSLIISFSAITKVVKVATLASADKTKAIEALAKYYGEKKESIDIDEYITSIYNIGAEGEQDVKDKAVETLKAYIEEHKEDQKDVSVAIDLARKLGGTFEEEGIVELTTEEKIKNIREYHDSKKADPEKEPEVVKAADGFTPVSSDTVSAYGMIFDIVMANAGDAAAVSAALENMAALVDCSDDEITKEMFINDLFRLVPLTQTDSHADVIAKIKTLATEEKDSLSRYGYIVNIQVMVKANNELKESAVDLLKEIQDYGWDNEADAVRNLLRRYDALEQEAVAEERTALEEIAWQKDNYESLDDVDKDAAIAKAITNIMNVVADNKDKQEECDAAVEAIIEMAGKTESDISFSVITKVAGIATLAAADKMKSLETLGKYYADRKDRISPDDYFAALYEIGNSGEQDVKDKAVEMLKAELGE